MRPVIITNAQPATERTLPARINTGSCTLPPPQAPGNAGFLNIPIFVYGTLRLGESNHRLLNGAEYVGTRHTRPGFTMLSLGGFPGVIDSGDTSIVGELFRVTSEAMLADLDRLEGHPKWYKRTPITLLEGDLAEIYLYPKGVHCLQLPIVVSGDWSNRIEKRFLSRKEMKESENGNAESSIHFA